MSNRRVLVVGTTPDYVAYLRELYPGRVLFLIDRELDFTTMEIISDDDGEIITNLSDAAGTLKALQSHLNKKRQILTGVACFDCEWLVLAAELAANFDLPYPSVNSVRLSRNKYLTKKAWAENRICCPEIELVDSVGQLLGLIERFGGPVVLKPLTGSGSELTFRCDDVYDLTTAYRQLTDGLVRRINNPLFRSDPHIPEQPTKGSVILAEEFIEGREYSADFIVDGDNIILIRVAKKISNESLTFGSTMAYIVPARLPGWLDHEMLQRKLYEAAKALGFTHAVCMADFIINKEKIVFLELTPRIGGDCLPMLIKRSSGLDTIGLVLDLAEGNDIRIPDRKTWKYLVGLRLFADREGTITSVDTEGLMKDPRVEEVYIKFRFPHVVVLPPENYESHILGHIIFRPDDEKNLINESIQLLTKIKFRMENHKWVKAVG